MKIDYDNKPRRSSPKGRYFFSQKQMREYRWIESLMFAQAKRENRPIRSYHGFACGCGCGPVPTEDSEHCYTLTAPTPPQPKKPTKRKPKQQHLMFSGNIV